MALFEKITLQWKGQEFAIAPDQVLRAIAVVEEEISLIELSRELSSGEYKLARLAKAYGRLLRAAGCKVTDEEVYVGIFPSSGGERVVREALAALQALMYLMVPPGVLTQPAGEAGDAAGKPSAASSASSTN